MQTDGGFDRYSDEHELHPETGQPQVEEKPDDVPENTPEQIAFLKAQEDAWAEERTWPLWEVDLEGDPVLWKARPGVNIAEETGPVTLEIDGETVFDQLVNAGEPAPWVAVARCSVVMHARNEDHAKMLALRAEPDYFTVVSAKQRETE